MGKGAWMPCVPTLGGCVPTALNASYCLVSVCQLLSNPHKKIRLLNPHALHLSAALYAMPIDRNSHPKTNLPFDSVVMYLVGSEEQLAYSAVFKHDLKISSVEELPLETSDGL